MIIVLDQQECNEDLVIFLGYIVDDLGIISTSTTNLIFKTEWLGLYF